MRTVNQKSFSEAITGGLMILSAVGGLTACATTASDKRAADQYASLVRDGVAVIVDTCLYRQNPPLVSNYFLRQESLASAQMIQANVSARLLAKGLRVPTSRAPYLCGSLANDPPSKPRIADRLGAASVVASEFPVRLRSPVTVPADAGKAESNAELALMQWASERLLEPRPRKTRRSLTETQRRMLKALGGSGQLLIVFAKGSSISTGLAVTDVVMGLLLGGGGCRLGEDDCDYRSTTHEGSRADALLVDLDVDPELEPPRLAKPVDIGKRSALAGDIDPLKLPPYGEAEWADRLLDSLDLPDLSHRPGARP